MVKMVAGMRAEDFRLTCLTALTAKSVGLRIGAVRNFYDQSINDGWESKECQEVLKKIVKKTDSPKVAQQALEMITDKSFLENVVRKNSDILTVETAKNTLEAIKRTGEPAAGSWNY